MPLAKEQRNRDFIADWKGLKLSNADLGVKYGLDITGVKSLKGRLRRKDPKLYEKGPASKPAIQQPSKLPLPPEGEKKEPEPLTRKPAKQQASKLAEYKKVTYYLDPAMAKDIKRLAVERDMDISELVREVLGEYLKNK